MEQPSKLPEAPTEQMMKREAFAPKLKVELPREPPLLSTALELSVPAEPLAELVLAPPLLEQGLELAFERRSLFQLASEPLASPRTIAQPLESHSQPPSLPDSEPLVQIAAEPLFLEETLSQPPEHIPWPQLSEELSNNAAPSEFQQPPARPLLLEPLTLEESLVQPTEPYNQPLAEELSELPEGAALVACHPLQDVGQLKMPEESMSGLHLQSSSNESGQPPEMPHIPKVRHLHAEVLSAPPKSPPRNSTPISVHQIRLELSPAGPRITKKITINIGDILMSPP